RSLCIPGSRLSGHNLFGCLHPIGALPLALSSEFSFPLSGSFPGGVGGSVPAFC
ncbi:hypothetical protein Tco_1097261, partial [Tanacetum coccineum]